MENTEFDKNKAQFLCFVLLIIYKNVKSCAYFYVGELSTP